MAHALRRSGLRGVGGFALAALLLAFGAGCSAAGAGASTLGEGVAAVYDGGGQVAEDEVTAYIGAYRAQSGTEGDAAAWEAYLAERHLTPELLREKTIRQLVIDAVAEQRAVEAGISVDDEEIEAQLDAMKDSLAFGDDAIFEETLQLYGRTADDMRALYAHEALLEELLEQEVPLPQPTEEEVAAYVAQTYPSGATFKHVYYFHLAASAESDEPSYDDLVLTQTLLSDLKEEGLTPEHFAAAVDAYGEGEELKARGGDLGYDLGELPVSVAAQNAIDATAVGAVSGAFIDDASYGFVWVDSAYDLSANQEDAASLAALPEELQEALTEKAAEALWQEDCQEYLSKLYEDSQVDIAPMPEGLPYATTAANNG